MTWLLVAIGGGFGAICRSLLSGRWNSGNARYPFGTWVSNVSGSLLLGFLVVLYETSLISQSLWLFFGVGFCGAYTTFSTFGKETITLINNGKMSTAFLYVSASLISTLLVVGLIFFVFI